MKRIVAIWLAQVVLMLILGSASVTGASPGGNINSAAETGDLLAVQQAIKNGADPNTRDTEGYTPLIRAATNGHLDVVRYLLQHGADIKTRETSMGLTPLMLAAGEGHFDIVGLLLERGAEINAKSSKYSYTALATAMKNEYFDIAKFLIEKGADLTGRAQKGQPLIMGAVYDVDLLRQFIQKGCNVNGTDSEGRSVLMYAARSGNPAAVRALLEAGAKSNISDNEGQTALMIAAQKYNGTRATVEVPQCKGKSLRYRYDHVEVAQLLLQHGADVNMRDKKGKTALDYAKEASSLDKGLMKLLSAGTAHN